MSMASICLRVPLVLLLVYFMMKRLSLLKRFLDESANALNSRHQRTTVIGIPV